MSEFAISGWDVPNYLWIVITIAAAFLQNIRSSLQKHLKGRLGTTGVTFIRFGFGVPLALAFIVVPHLGFGMALPEFNTSFAFWIVIAALSQIAAQVCLIAAFSHHNFAVATAYSRTEPLHAAIFGLVLLGETMGWLDLSAVLLAFVGVCLISLGKQDMTIKNMANALKGRGALLGLASGTIFGLAAVAYRAASTSLDGPNFFMQGAFTLSVAIVLQSVVLLIFMVLREPQTLRQIAAAWRPAILVGLVGATASLGWFTAMTLQQAAMVKAVAQVEMLFAYVTGFVIFKERLNRIETLGCLAIVAGVILLVINTAF